MKMQMECVGNRKKTEKSIQYTFKCPHDVNPSSIDSGSWFQDGTVYVDSALGGAAYETGKTYTMELTIS